MAIVAEEADCAELMGVHLHMTRQLVKMKSNVKSP
jgi:hypothetical protein